MDLGRWDLSLSVSKSAVSRRQVAGDELFQDLRSRHAGQVGSAGCRSQ